MNGKVFPRKILHHSPDSLQQTAEEVDRTTLNPVSEFPLIRSRPDISHIVAAPPPAAPRQPMSAQPSGVAAIKKPMSALAAHRPTEKPPAARVFFENSQGRGICKRLPQLPIHRRLRREIHLLENLHRDIDALVGSVAVQHRSGVALGGLNTRDTVRSHFASKNVGGYDSGALDVVAILLSA